MQTRYDIHFCPSFARLKSLRLSTAAILTAMASPLEPLFLEFTGDDVDRSITVGTS